MCLLCCLVPQDGLLHKTADWALAVAIPVHMHITTNALVTDYVATRFRGVSCSQHCQHTSHRTPQHSTLANMVSTQHTAHCRHGQHTAQHTAALPAHKAAVLVLPLVGLMSMGMSHRQARSGCAWLRVEAAAHTVWVCLDAPRECHAVLQTLILLRSS